MRLSYDLQSKELCNNLNKQQKKMKLTSNPKQSTTAFNNLNDCKKRTLTWPDLD